jgi:hypothetical protein
MYFEVYSYYIINCVKRLLFLIEKPSFKSKLWIEMGSDWRHCFGFLRCHENYWKS